MSCLSTTNNTINVFFSFVLLLLFGILYQIDSCMYPVFSFFFCLSSYIICQYVYCICLSLHNKKKTKKIYCSSLEMKQKYCSFFHSFRFSFLGKFFDDLISIQGNRQCLFNKKTTTTKSIHFYFV